jgi:hypothetical protein
MNYQLFCMAAMCRELKLIQRLSTAANEKADLPIEPGNFGFTP